MINRAKGYNLIAKKNEILRKNCARRLIKALCNKIEQENKKSNTSTRKIQEIWPQSDLVDWSKWDYLRFQ